MRLPSDITLKSKRWPYFLLAVLCGGVFPAMAAVRPIPEQETVLLTLESTKPQVIIDEAFTITLRILVRRLKQPYADASPLPEQAPPFLSIPYLDENPEEKRLESEDIRERLNSLLTGGGSSFRINNYTVGSGDPFAGLFGNGHQARFALEKREVEHNGLPYLEYRLPIRFTPRQEGAFTFGPVVFKGPVFVSVTPSGQGQAETIYAIAEAITVRAVPPPMTNRPATYIGAIGSNLTVTASLNAQTCYIGDPLTLTLAIRGDVRLDAITAPRLGTQASLNRDFRIYEDTVQRTSGEGFRQYRFTVRPSRTGTLEFPPVAVAYYDTTIDDYRIATSEPLPVRVNAVTEVQTDTIIDTGTQSITIRATDDDAQLPPAPFSMAGSLTATTPFFLPRLHLPLLLVGPAFYLLALALRLWRRLRPAIRVNRQRRCAAADTIRQLQKKADGPGNTAPAIVLRDYLATRIGPAFTAATPAECERLLLSAGAPTDLAARFARCLETCARAAFAQPVPPEADTATLSREAAALVTELENALRAHFRRQSSPPWKRLAMLIAIACTATAPLSTGAPGARSDLPVDDFEEQKAATLLLRAAETEEFTATAETLATLIDNGAANATLFYNYGTALLMANQPGNALEALARAEYYSGTTWEIRRNMRLARQAQTINATATTLPWQRIPLFWHYQLPTTTRLTIAATAFSAIWLLAVFCRGARRHEILVLATWIAIAVCLLFSASVLASFHAEHNAAIMHAQRQSSEVQP